MAKRVKTGGRVAGTPNKGTAGIRAAFLKMVEENIDNFPEWMARVAAEDASKALDFMFKFSEYLLPKLARTEHTGLDDDKGKPQAIKISLDLNRDGK